MRVVVIGSGFGGLSAAVRLQAQGHQVTIVENLDKPGGRAYVFERDGFQFDAGPTIITAPWMIDDIFAAAGKRTDAYVRIVPIRSTTCALKTARCSITTASASQY